MLIMEKPRCKSKRIAGKVQRPWIKYDRNTEIIYIVECINGGDIPRVKQPRLTNQQLNIKIKQIPEQLKTGYITSGYSPLKVKERPLIKKSINVGTMRVSPFKNKLTPYPKETEICFKSRRGMICKKTDNLFKSKYPCG